MLTNRFTRALGAAAVVALAGCQSLDVTNPNSPGPAAVVGQLPGGAMQAWFNSYTSLRGAGVFSVQARTYSSSWNNGNLYYHGRIYLADLTPLGPTDTITSPTLWTRSAAPFFNDPAASARTTIESFWTGGLDESSTSRPGMYSSLGLANLALKTIRVDQADVANVGRAETMSQLMQGAAMMVIALNYDQAYIITENTDLTQDLPFVSRKVLRDSAVTWLLRAATLAQANVFTTDGSWTGPAQFTYTNDDIAKIAYTMAAMTLAYYPRTSAEAATEVNWTDVVTYASQGISSGTGGADWHFSSDGYNAWVSELMNWFNSIDTGRLSTRVAHFMDPATQIDPYVLGVGSPQPNSPDARMGDGTFGPASISTSFGTVPEDAGHGTDFMWSSRGEIFRPDRGFYHQSNIGQIRYDASKAQDPNDVYGAFGVGPAISATQNDLVWAEGLLRRNGAGDAAAAVTLIDNSRVVRGGLPSSVVAVANVGSPSDGPCMANNVLALDGGICTLWSYLLYENEVELLGLGPAPGWNQRRLPVLIAADWETVNRHGIFNGPRFIQGLLPQTPREMPVPVKELSVLGMPTYTWGGASNPANSPTP